MFDLPVRLVSQRKKIGTVLFLLLIAVLHKHLRMDTGSHRDTTIVYSWKNPVAPETKRVGLLTDLSTRRTCPMIIFKQNDCSVD